MMNKKNIIYTAFLAAFIASTYNACSKFQTLDSEFSPLAISNENSGASVNSTDNPNPSSNNSNNSNSTPQGNETPTPGNSVSKGWSNEPAGAQVVLDCPMNNLAECGIQDIYKSSQIVADGLVA